MSIRRFKEGTFRGCVCCTHWHDPANSCLTPSSSRGFWEYEANEKRKCLLTRCDKPAQGSCMKFERKL